MPKVSNRQKAPDIYFELVGQFPLRPICSDKELDRASHMIDSLLDKKKLSRAEQDYLVVLSDIVERYEDEHHPIDDKPVGDADMLRFLIESNEVTQSEVAKHAEIAESTISEILSGKRSLNRSHIDKLAHYFHVDPGVFMSLATD